MDNPGPYTLAALAVTAPLTAQVQTPITDLDGMLGLTLEASWSGGTGGTSVTADVQTSLDGGTTWRDIARFDFTTAADVKQCNLSGLLSKAIGDYAPLSANTVNDGILGDQLQVVITSVGTFTGTGGTLTVRAVAR
jgi:hypothetical protein